MTYQTAAAKVISVDPESGISGSILCELIGLDELKGHSDLEYSSAVVSLTELLSFYNDTRGIVSCNAADFIGREKAAYYSHVLERAVAILAPLVSTHKELPQSRNTWLKKSRRQRKSSTRSERGKKQDWAILAPLGATLASAFDGDARAVSILLGQNNYDFGKPEKLAVRKMLLKAEQSTSIEYDRLSIAIAGSVVGNLVWRILNISRKKPGSSSAKQLKRYSEELLNIIDTLALRESSTATLISSVHIAFGQRWRANRLLKTRLKNYPGDVEVTRMAASYRSMQSSRSKAIEDCKSLMKRLPDDVTLKMHLSAAYRRRLEYGQAKYILEKALRQEPGNPEVESALNRTRQLEFWFDAAEDDTVMPAISLLDDERLSGMPLDETIALAAHLYEKYGTLHIENVFDIKMLEKCRSQFLEVHRERFTAKKQEDALQIGDKRYQISVAIEGHFNQPDFYANPFVIALMKRLLGRRPIVGSVVCATSVPGAKDQHLHKDHRAIFTNHAEDEPISIPAVAVTTMIPLVDLNEKTGSTLVKKGSHLLSTSDSKKLPSQVPNVSLGSCYLMDMSLSHMGIGNTSDMVRPIINMVYQRSWFADNKNFKLQRPLEIPRSAYCHIPKEYRYLFDWADQPGALLNARN